eukprot:3797710-Lingulodinium_polyedra.AAC.1
MINGPDCSRLASSGHRWKAAEGHLEWQQEHGPSPNLAPLNSEGVWPEHTAGGAGEGQKRLAEEHDVPKLIP